jgi:hypothetical protein
MSHHFPSRKQDPRSVPSRVKPAFSSDRCSASLPASVSAATRFSWVCANRYSASSRCA